MRRSGLMLVLLAGVALGGCGREARVFPLELPAELQALYDQIAGQPTAEALVRIGSLEVQRRAWLKAEQAFTRALEMEPNNAEATAGLASLKLSSGDRATASAMVERLDEENRDSSEVQAAVGDLYLALGARDLAIGSWGRAIDLNADNHAARYRLVQAALGGQDIATAKRHYQVLAAKLPGSERVRELRLAIAGAEFDGETVERLLRERLADHPVAQYRDDLASFLLNSGRFADCEAVIQAWMDDHPLAPKPPTEPEALEEWKKTRREGYILPQTQMAGVLRTAGRAQEARRMAGKLLETIETVADRGEPAVEPEIEAEVRLVYAQALFADGRPDVAITHIRRVRELTKGNMGMLLRLANTLAEFNADTQYTLELYNDVLQNDASRRSEALRHMTVFLQQVAARSEQEPAAPLIEAIERQYIALLQENANDILALNNLAWHLARYSSDDTSKMNVALTCIQRALQLSGRNPNLLDTMGYVLLKRNDLAGAEALFREALESLPKSGEIHFHLALVAEARGDRENAARLAQVAVQSKEQFDGLLKAKELARATAWRGGLGAAP